MDIVDGSIADEASSREYEKWIAESEKPPREQQSIQIEVQPDTQSDSQSDTPQSTQPISKPPPTQEQIQQVLEIIEIINQNRALKPQEKDDVFEHDSLYPSYTEDSFKSLQDMIRIEKEAREKEEERKKLLNTVVTVSKKKKKKRAEGDPLLELDPRSKSWICNLITAITTIFLISLYGLIIYEAVNLFLDTGSIVGIANLATLPLSTLFLLFAIQIIISNILAMMGPISWLDKNSKFFSAIPPDEELMENLLKKKLPVITVQIPVYKESLELTIKPTILSVLDAVAEYARHGGEAKIFINDDGLLLLSPDDRLRRMAFYREYQIAFVARPGRNRKGKFKKASNLNYALSKALSIKRFMRENNIEDYSYGFQEFVRLCKEKLEPADYFEMGGDIRLGEFILILDSDTRIPHDCMLPVMAEFAATEKLAYTQHYTTPMQIQFDYWEDMIANFTYKIYDAIALMDSWGFSPPLVGHNAFLRVSAMTEVAESDPDNIAANKRLAIKHAALHPDPKGKKKEVPVILPEDSIEDYIAFWSESHVSEDFQMSIRMMRDGYFGRYVRYTGDNFKEGVSLTVHEEIRKMQKFTWGVAEVMFNPFSQWLTRSPFSTLFREYISSRNITYTDKLVTLAYLGTYAAIAFAWIGSPMSFILISYFWEAEWIMPSSMDIVIACSVVFGCLGYVAMAVFTYRHKRKAIWITMARELKYSVLLGIFFSGLSYHLMVPFVKYLFGLHMEWGSTIKEVEHTNFFKEVKRTISAYKVLYIWSLIDAGAVVALWFLPDGYEKWRIHNHYVIIPMVLGFGMPAMMPVFLNPVLMQVKF